MDSATIEKVATTAVIAGAAFLASKIFETGWKITTKRPVPAEDADDVTLTSLVIFAATSAALAAVAQRYAYKGSQKWLAPKLAARFGVPQLEARDPGPLPCPHTSGRRGPRAVRSPDALTSDPATASSHVRSPHASDSHVRASVSTTAGGVPRRCVVPGRICTAPAGGTRTSTDRPGCSAPSSSSVKRTAVKATGRGASSPRSTASRHARSASIPLVVSIRRFAMRRFYVRNDSRVGAHSDRSVRHN